MHRQIIPLTEHLSSFKVLLSQTVYSSSLLGLISIIIIQDYNETALVLANLMLYYFSKIMNGKPFFFYFISNKKLVALSYSRNFRDFF